MSLRPAWRPLRLSAGWSRQIQRAATASTTTPYSPRYETLEKCPDPTCSCASIPEMPEGLPIDRAGKMSMPYYDRHVVLAGDVDAQKWPSKLEQDEKSLVKRLKDMLGPKGDCYRPDFSVSVTASTLSPPSQDDSTQVYIFPDFISTDVTTTEHDLKSFGKTIVDDKLLETGHRARAITSPVVLICGHGQRDQRCGIMGPLLQAEFERHLASRSDTRSPITEGLSCLVGQVSHIGGHKFAGNVVIYLPPGFSANKTQNNLAGQAIWYGRVEPRHVEGIINETIHGGKVITELLRGVHDFGRMKSARS